ncbi:hypothetical protein [Oceanibacterium hippocampi]|uniref:Transmembrane protein (PGPGW) n=1 Tax=Oceanibacterium hippocampi TaxID=745714 RepID=A0A1Y5SWT6_9PROT|nr:hypothetical protein [Oceanibacterium hippocampi]SLN50238.1 hypothetical protein OCH7691_02209 [Oceanibacterium hippocampi]
MSPLRKVRKRLPASRVARIAIGVLLVIGGLLGFLPVLGFWMIPLGAMVLSIDLPAVRRLRRRVEVWWGRERPAWLRLGARRQSAPSGRGSDAGKGAPAGGPGRAGRPGADGRR